MPIVPTGQSVSSEVFDWKGQLYSFKSGVDISIKWFRLTEDISPNWAGMLEH
ncbi:MAG TPA: hypothetical protein VGB72_08170 [Acidobacteriota bacterium]